MLNETDKENSSAGDRGVAAPVFVASGISKHFGDTKALDRVDFETRAGEVHALLGANGAGKSTLAKIIAGVQPAMAGKLELDGREVSFANQREATDHGIATVSQELNLFPDLSVLENLFLMREPRRGGAVMNRSEMRVKAKPVLDRIGLPASVLGRPLSSLSLGARQLVEIARALLEQPRMLILDEPTSALKASETRRLLEVVKELRGQDVAILFVSHFLEDVFQIADCVTVLRSGRVIERATPLPKLTPESVIEAMLGHVVTGDAGRDVTPTTLPMPSPKGKVESLVLKDATIRGTLRPLSLTAAAGEVVGLAGLEGSGASETLKMLFGAIRLSGGTVRLPSGRGAPRSELAAVRSGVAYVPADRKADGLLLEEPIYENVAMVTAGPLKRLGILPRKKAKLARVEAWRESIGLVMPSPKAAVEVLSGGNQQKIVFAKWLDTAPTLVLLDDPTRGVDVGAKADMLKLIRAVADSGRVVLYTSTDLDEMSRVCDRVLVFYRGGVVGELQQSLNEESLLDAVTRGTVGDGRRQPAPAA